MFATLVLFLVALSLLFYLESRKPKGYPPGPKWWPIVGCALQVARIRKETGYLFKTCSALRRKYGPVVGLKIGSDRIVVLNDYKSMKAMYGNEDCDGRPSGPMYQARTWGARRGLLVVDGRFWIEQRRFVLRHLREFGLGRTHMAAIVEDESIRLVQHFKKLLQQAKEIKDDVPIKYNNNNTNIDNNNDVKDKFKHKSPHSSSNGKDKERNSPSMQGKKKRKSVSDLYATTTEDSYISGIILPMHNAFGVSVLNALWRMMADKRYNHDDQELTHLQKILTKLLEDVDMIGAPFSHFPILRTIAPVWSGYKSFIDTHQQLWKFLRDELENHKKTFKAEAPRDLMDAYLSALKSEDVSETFSESQLLAICMDLFMAGSETTSKTLSFAFLHLVLQPSIQQKAQEEIDRVIGRERYPTLADRPRMPYINAIVFESLRMFMGRTLNIPHRAIKDTYILEHRIPKDTMIVVNFNGVLMNDFWEDPEEFRPERFIDSNGSVFIPDQYFPFSLARHRCMGEVLAKSNVFLLTAALLQTFNFCTVPGDEIKAGYVDGVTSGPTPYRALVTLRN